jgi:hypothetical protein
VETLYEAAVFGDVDEVVGVTPNVMLGQLCPIGTGVIDICESDEMVVAHTRVDLECVVHSRMSFKTLKTQKPHVDLKISNDAKRRRIDDSKTASVLANSLLNISGPNLPFMETKSSTLQLLQGSRNLDDFM